MKKLFEALFAFLRKLAPVLIAILIIMLAVWVSMCAGCLTEDGEVSIQPVIEEPVGQPGLAHDTEPIPDPVEEEDE